MRPSRKWSVRNTELKSTRILYTDSSNRLLLTRSSKRTSNNTDLVEPTQYQIDPNRKAKEPPPEPWSLPVFNHLHISDHGDLILLILLAILIDNIWTQVGVPRDRSPIVLYILAFCLL